MLYKIKITARPHTFLKTITRNMYRYPSHMVSYILLYICHQKSQITPLSLRRRFTVDQEHVHTKEDIKELVNSGRFTFHDSQ